MTRYTPSGQVTTIPQIQAELENIQTAINDTLSRKGDTPNGMEADFDMNNHRILNHPAPVNPTDLVRAQDLNGLLPEGGNLLIVSNTENVVLTEAQTAVVFSDVTTTQTAYYVSGVNVDQGRLSPTVDYNVTNSTTITLTSTFPTGTIITAVQNEGAEEVQSDIQVFDNVAVMKAAPLNTGDTALCLRYYAGGDLVDGLLYEVKSSGTTDGYINHDLANGNKVFLLHSGTVSLKQAGVSGSNLSAVLDALVANADIDEVKASGAGFLTATATVNIGRSITITSENREGCYIQCPDNVPLFEGTGSVTQFKLNGISFVAGSGNSQVIRVLNSANWFEGRVEVNNNRFNGFNTWPLEFEDSVYIRETKGNRFDNCNGCMKEGWASDSVFVDNQINDIEGTNASLHLVGGAKTIVAHNIFIPGSSGNGMGPDILLDPNTSFGRGGRVYVHHNKFGGEFERANRVKVQALNATTTNRSVDVTFSYNQLHGALEVDGGVSTAFKLDNPIALWDISHNEFDDMNIIVDDNYTSSTGNFGGSVIENNRYYASTRTDIKLFTNGGRGFTRVNEPTMGCRWGINILEEPRELRNRISYSSSLGNWNRSSGVTVTPGQADPYGGTDAALFEADGTTAAQIFFRAIDKTTGGAWGTDSLISEFWLKEGTTNQLVVGLRDTTDGVFVGTLEFLSLRSEWTKYQLKFNGLDNTHDFALYFYPVDSIKAEAGSVYLSHPQVSEYESDYLPTPLNIGAAQTGISKRFNKGISAPNLPTSSAGLQAGAFWNDAGTVKVVL